MYIFHIFFLLKLFDFTYIVAYPKAFVNRFLKKTGIFVISGLFFLQRSVYMWYDIMKTIAVKRK